MLGRTISHYRIDAELGRGGMGVVYRAWDERLRRNVALKLLPEEIAGRPEHRARILAEARAAAALNHPVITTIHEVGEEGDQLFIVMELLTGQTLRVVLGQGPMPSRAAIRLAAQVAEGLAVAHLEDVIHGDIKPENIMLQADERVKLLDFGIARQMAAETVTLTRGTASAGATRPPDAQIAGTLAYMAPEQLRGDATDGRADLFSFGVVLYEMVACRRPFLGPSSMALMSQILDNAPPPLAGAPAELARIVQKLLEKRPESRYQSAREVQVDLTNLTRDLERGAAAPFAVAVVPGKRAVAVLPFKLLTPNPEDEFLSVALAEAVINQLSAPGDLLVRPTSTVLRYGNEVTNPLEAARELNVQVVVDGSIQKFGPKLRVHVQAWNAADGSTLISAKHDSEMADLFGLQDEIAEGLARALGAATPAETQPTPAPPTADPMAYQLFLRAGDRLSRLTRWDTRTAIEMLESATAADAGFADGWARLAQASLMMAVTFEPGPTWIRRAEAAIRRARAIDRNNAEAECARGRVLWSAAKRFQNRAALRALADALRINPGCYEALKWQCCIQLHVGLLEEARQGLARCLAIQPDDAFNLSFAAQTALYSGRYEEAEEYYNRALAVDPANLWANLFAPVVPVYSDRLDRAEARLASARQVMPSDPILPSYDAMVWARRGEKRKAERSIQKALRGGKPLLHTHHMLHNVACAYALIGKPAPAVSLLRKAAGTGLPNYPVFRDDPHLRPLHTYPQFLRLMNDLKREWTAYRREFGVENGKPEAGSRKPE